MKIIQVVTQLDVGGVPWVAIQIAEELRKRGHDIETWFLYTKNPAYTDYLKLKIFCDRKPNRLDYFKIIIRLGLDLRSEQPDILITHSHYANIIGQLMAKGLAIPKRIAVQHNPLFTYPKIAQWADLFLGTMGLYTANVGVSQSVLESASHYPASYKSSLKTIYNGISEPPNQNFPQPVRASWNLPENVPLILNVARLAHQKNQGVLIEALPALPEVHLVLAGEGELRTALQQKVANLGLEKRVHFLGEVKHQEIWGLLQVADIFAFPSLYEGMGIAVAEAMFAGLPVIASNILTMQEIVGDAGILVAPNGVQQIVEAVQKILYSPGLMQQMSQRSKARSQQFSLSKMIRAYEALLI